MTERLEKMFKEWDDEQLKERAKVQHLRDQLQNMKEENKRLRDLVKMQEARNKSAIDVIDALVDLLQEIAPDNKTVREVVRIMMEDD